MDTSKEYIKMCEKARDVPDAYQDGELNIIKLFRQDQSQGMVKVENISKLLARFWKWYEETDVYIFTSMEQLWVAFVMSERFGKHWSGKDWIGE